MTTNIKLAAGMALALAMLALSPTATALPTDDTLSRTFVYVSGARGEIQGSGNGWYDANTPPNVCLISLLGVQTPIAGVFYYETARTYVNFPGFTAGQNIDVPPAGPGGIFVPAACPFILNPACGIAPGGGCGIYIEDVQLAPLARTLVPQDGSICTQASAFITCTATDGDWSLASCQPGLGGLVGFVPRPLPELKGVLGGSGVENLVLSKDINCAGAGYTAATDYSHLLGSGGNPLGTDFDGATLSAVITFGNNFDNSGWVASCLVADYNTLDTSTVPPTPGTDTEDGVDYFLALDLDRPAGWTAPIVTHLNGIGGGHVAAAGLYDLGGNNGCDFGPGAAPGECENGIDDADADPLVDIKDPQCFSVDPVTGLMYYNPKNLE